MPTDTFTGTDGQALGTYSANWIVKPDPNDILIESGIATPNVATPYPFYGTTAQFNPAVTGAADDQFSQGPIRFSGFPSGVNPGVAVRLNSDGEGYAARYAPSGGQVTIMRMVFTPGSGFSDIGLTVDGTQWFDGDVMRLEVQGTTLTLLRSTDGGVTWTQTAQVTDLSYSSGQYGLAMIGTSTTVGMGAWTGGDMLPGVAMTGSSAAASTGTPGHQTTVAL